MNDIIRGNICRWLKALASGGPYLSVQQLADTIAIQIRAHLTEIVMQMDAEDEAEAKIKKGSQE